MCVSKYQLKVKNCLTVALATVPVSKPVLLMSDASPVEGSTMWMRCSLDNGTEPVHYEWSHESRSGNTTVFAQGNSSAINVTDVSRKHTGWYRCLASNSVNSESSNRLWLDTICEQPVNGFKKRWLGVFFCSIVG